MAKLSNIIKKKDYIPTSIDGLYIKNLPIKDFELHFEKLTELLNNRKEIDAVVYLFNCLITDEKGEQFEDALTDEDVKANFSIMDMSAILQAVPEALNGTVKPGNS